MNNTTDSQAWTPANTVTVFRIVGVPFLVVVMLAPWETLFSNAQLAAALKPWICAALFLLLSFSDFLDGYLARSRNEVTTFGKFMDPLADKLLVIAVMLVLVQTGQIPAWVVLIVLFREFLVSGLRMMAASKGLVIAASWYGKAKTVTQMIALVLFILIDALPAVIGHNSQRFVFLVAWTILMVSLILTVFSMIDYFKQSKSVFSETSNSENTSSALQELLLLTPAIFDETVLDLPKVSEDNLYELARITLVQAREKSLLLGSAESLTGGMISAALTAIPGSSDTFVGGVASYAYSAKARLLGVDEERLNACGAVNEWTAQQMAEEARNILNCSIAVSVTGIAGPGGEEPEKPVGTVWCAVSSLQGTRTKKFIFSGDREQVRAKTTAAALLLLQNTTNTLEAKAL